MNDDLIRIQACEERLVNAWPGMETVLLGDWLIRFAQGYSGRANSAMAVRPDAGLDAHDLAHVVALYEAAGLKPSIRVSPLVAARCIHQLEGLGYAPEDGSFGMIAPAQRFALRADITLETSPTPAWLEGVCRWQARSKRNPAHLHGIISRIRIPAVFATIQHAGQPAGYATAALDRGMVEIGAVMIDPALRGQGIGRKLIEGLMDWGHRMGAHAMFLQVATDNAVAQRLYRGFDFSILYEASYYRRR